MNIRVLCLEPFGGGSHADFWHGWARNSRHHLTVLELPGVHWKWRSRHASLTLAIQASQLADSGRQFDVVLCSDMLNLPEWRGMASENFRRLPSISYFHENQFTYPLASGVQRDFHYAYNNVLTAVAADQVWFNSDFHRREFARAATDWLKRMPDFTHVKQFESAISNSQVLPPGIDSADLDRIKQRGREPKKTAVIGWVARWEHDKRPDVFADVIEQLLDEKIDFNLILLGQQFSRPCKSLKRIKHIAADRIKHVGYADSRQSYWRLLRQVDVVVSTAEHEFFGLGIVESVAAGATPLLPNRLAYPEVFGLREDPRRDAFFYQDRNDLLHKLRLRLTSYPDRPPQLELDMQQFYWRNLVDRYDDALEALC